MTTNYQRGYAFELRVRDDLLGRDYFVVRSAGSKGPVDLVAVAPKSRGGDLYFVQCKRSGRMTKGERTTLGGLAKDYGAVAMVASQTEIGIQYQYCVEAIDV